MFVSTCGNMKLKEHLVYGCFFLAKFVLFIIEEKAKNQF